MRAVPATEPHSPVLREKHVGQKRNAPCRFSRNDRSVESATEKPNLHFYARDVGNFAVVPTENNFSKWKPFPRWFILCTSGYAKTLHPFFFFLSLNSPPFSTTSVASLFARYFVSLPAIYKPDRHYQSRRINRTKWRTVRFVLRIGIKIVPRWSKSEKNRNRDGVEILEITRQIFTFMVYFCFLQRWCRVAK